MPNDKIPSGDKLSLIEQIRLQINTQGPMSLATYMRLCLTHPELGYYKNADPLGARGDFVTAPEVSQLFGEMLGIWVLVQFHALGCPQNFNLLELGPGRGTLMSDALRVIAKDKKASAALQLILLETNPALVELQAQSLSNHQPRWITEIDQLSNTNHPLIILANEFFDALPIKQFQFQDDNWHERLIGLKEDALTWGLSQTPMPDGTILPDLENPEQNAIWETSPLALHTTEQLARRIAKCGGAMMIIDYGYTKTQTGDTFQAVTNHAFADPLKNPGKADLSAHVDFDALNRAAKPHVIQTQMAGTQGEVLRALDIMTRTENLLKSNPNKTDSILSGLERLINPDQMGDLFKVMTLFSHIPAPAETDSELDKHPNITHGFFGRQGGSSIMPFASLNVSKMSDDDPHNVLINRSIAADTLNLPIDKLICVHQIHSAKVITVDENHDPVSMPQADAMVTKVTGLGLGILTADCTPILFVDPQALVIGACHAGWQGAVSGIITNTITAMEKLGANRTRILAAFGPTIWPQNYEVGPDWTKDFLSKHPTGKDFISLTGASNTQHFNLPGFVHAELENNQVANISQIGQCTYANPKLYFSHRFATHQKQKTGRQISIIALK